VTLPVIILGAGGHARVLAEALRANRIRIIGCTAAAGAPDPGLPGLPFLGGDDVVAGHDPSSVRLVNGLGSVGRAEPRIALFERFKRQGFMFATVLHPAAWIADDVICDEGAQVMAGARLQTGCRIGADAIINTGAVVDHDGRIGAHCHVAPGAVLSGDVQLGEGAHVGTGACVIQGIRIGRYSLVAAGAAVVQDVPEHCVVAGVPARVIRQSRVD
jgi:UDP-perosamine 4-acetyltransferase